MKCRHLYDDKFYVLDLYLNYYIIKQVFILMIIMEFTIISVDPNKFNVLLTVHRNISV
jgi:hypothetical protein